MSAQHLVMAPEKHRDGGKASVLFTRPREACAAQWPEYGQQLCQQYFYFAGNGSGDKIWLP
jgi:hypothetical protein